MRVHTHERTHNHTHAQTGIHAIMHTYSLKHAQQKTAEQLRMNASLSFVTHDEKTSLSSSIHAGNIFLSSSTQAAEQGR